MRDSNSIKKDEKYIPHFRRTVPYSEWGRSPEGEEGEQYSNVKGRTPVFIYEHAAPSERVLHEFAYNSETNGDGVKMFKLGRNCPS